MLTVFAFLLIDSRRNAWRFERDERRGAKLYIMLGSAPLGRTPLVASVELEECAALEGVEGGHT